MRWVILFAASLYAADLLDHPAINYNYAPVHDPIARLDPSKLKFEGPSGYLRSVLDALHVPVESQIAVFSKTSLQAPLIEPNNPRTIFFNDSVAVGWMKGGFIEIAALDPRQGVQFYKLQQRPDARPRFQRGSSIECLRCHVGDATLGVAGFVVRSTYTAADGSPMLIYGGSVVDHRTPIEDRWGGWFVTGSVGTVRHLGNAVIGPQGDPKAMEPLHGKFDSDVAALMVFDHQMRMANLITRIGWDTRAGVGKLEDEAREFVDYLLFVDEVPLPGKLGGPFAEVFAKNAIRDSKGRSLRDLDLQKRLLRYPCSYMIYSEAFDALPSEAKDAIYKRMRQVLSGSEKGKKYARLSAADRRAVLEILRETKKDFGGVVN
ncbi:MAG: hypothetical protein LAO55_13290 [Acidobacteriia bacterium]|nr:hypothetical protein [Terriglobia bacterium]